MELRPGYDDYDGYGYSVPYVSMTGADVGAFNLFISDDKGQELGSVLNVKPNEELKAATVLKGTNGYFLFSSYAGLQTINGSLILQVKIEATMNLKASSLGAQLEVKESKVLKDITALAKEDQLTDFIFTIDGQDFPIHKAILAGETKLMRSVFKY